MTFISSSESTIAKQQELVACARGDIPCDLVLKNGQVVNVFSGEILSRDVGIFQGRIAGIGHYKGHEETDIEQRYVCPGFIDGHIHLESSMLSPNQFAQAVVPRGTTAVVCDPHEITNVLGQDGIDYIIRAGKELPLDIFTMAPSCVPATTMETSGATISALEIEKLLHRPEVIGLAEMMNFFF